MTRELSSSDNESNPGGGLILPDEDTQYLPDHSEPMYHGLELKDPLINV